MRSCPVKQWMVPGLAITSFGVENVDCHCSAAVVSLVFFFIYNVLFYYVFSFYKLMRSINIPNTAPSFRIKHVTKRKLLTLFIMIKLGLCRQKLVGTIHNIQHIFGTWE